MRPVLAMVFVVAFAANAVAEMTPEEKSFHALHGLFHMYAVGSVCYYNKWSFSKRDTDEMLQKINELGKTVPQRDLDVMWTETRAMMAEGQDKTSAESCAMVRELYVKGRPSVFGTQKGNAG